MYSQATVIKAETMPTGPDVSSSSSSMVPEQVTTRPAEPAENVPPTMVNPSSAEAVTSSGGGFFGSFRKKMREAAGIDSPFVNPYLGNGHPSTRIPPYGQTSSSSPAGPPISSIPTHHPFISPQPPWDDYYYQQQAMMYGGGMFPYRMPTMNYPMGTGYYGTPYMSPYFYPSNSLLDYYQMHNPYHTGYPYFGMPYTASALPVQDKRLLPERNYFSAVKDIWHTNLQ
ncbi:uncharacterized protein BX664DRAFT_322389, partial [Halteromyces radiatus]|uniref:uncharacterized protein n=1 Tax=Halteromyces radiatus TaxID=101107 RepID=UPI00221F4C1B